MMKAPEILDGARVLFWAWSDETPFGYVATQDESERIAIFGLAICAYPGSPRVYRFSCDENWEVVQDSDYDSVEDAMEYLPAQYRLVRAEWQERS